MSTTHSLRTHPLASGQSRHKHCPKIITQNALVTHTNLTQHCMWPTMIYSSWYDRPTVVQLLTDNWWTYGQTDVWTDTEMPDRQKHTQRHRDNEWTYQRMYRQCMDALMGVQTYWQMYRHTNGHTDRKPDISRCLTTLNMPANCTYEVFKFSLVKAILLHLIELEN